MARGNPKPKESSGSVKAGKKKSYKAPPPVNKTKEDARLLGEQQFHSKVNFTEEVTVIKFKNGVMIPGTKHLPIPYRYDPTRKRIVYNTFWNPGPDGNGRAPR
jgi:hypothetical protein